MIELIESRFELYKVLGFIYALGFKAILYAFLLLKSVFNSNHIGYCFCEGNKMQLHSLSTVNVVEIKMKIFFQIFSHNTIKGYTSSAIIPFLRKHS